MHDRRLPRVELRKQVAAAASAGPVSHAALLRIDAEYLRFTPMGVELRLRARADAAEPTLRLPLARSAPPAACAVRALEDWLQASDAAFGPVFRKVDRWGNVEHARLGPDAWRRILARHDGKPRSAGMAERSRRAIAGAVAAASRLDAFLQSRAPALPFAKPSADLPLDATQALANVAAPARPTPVGQGGVRRLAGEGAPLRLAHTDWLFHQLDITGPAEVLRAFRDAAAGAGAMPWAIDFDLLEEDWFHRLAAAQELSLAGSRILARQLREAAERRHDLAVARVGRSRACPLDLHALVPTPTSVLALGPDHPDSLAWLWEHWGTTEPLRHVAIDDGADRHDAGDPTLRLSFWSADWSPWRAVERLRRDWPALRFKLQPRYDSGP